MLRDRCAAVVIEVVESYPSFLQNGSIYPVYTCCEDYKRFQAGEGIYDIFADPADTRGERQYFIR